MYRILTLAIISSVVFLKCSQEQEMFYQISPDTLIEEQKMAEIMADVHLTEAAIHQRLVGRYDKEVQSHLFYSITFEKHNISKETFDKNLRYYSQDYKKLEKIYEDIITILHQKKSEIQSHQKEKD